MDNWIPKAPTPDNEPVLEYRPNSPETKQIKEQLSAMSSREIEIPLIINGKEVRTGKTAPCVMPHNHHHKLGTYHKAGPEQVRAAVDGALKAQKEWASMPAVERQSIFLKAAEILATSSRQVANASTMLAQSKTCHQAEIDSACELIDFFRFNVKFQEELYAMQPKSAKGQWNRLQYRPLEGFVFAVTPFNFTSIGGNLPTSPALMGNVVIWKPASSVVYSNYQILKILEEAGLPPGVIQFLPGSGAEVGDPVMKDPHLAGVHFTGSTAVFQNMWKLIGENIFRYKTYPRVVGETGGKDFMVVHPSADVTPLAVAIIRGAYEYQGQKCSALSRVYVPKSIWRDLKGRLVSEIRQIKMGDVADFSNFMAAVIDKSSFDNIRSYIDEAKKTHDCQVIVGGECNDEVGYFVRPTLIETTNPKCRVMSEEIFGPVLSVYPYDDNKYEETLRLCDETSGYALTGAVFAQDRKAIQLAEEILTHSAGNYYINNKPTGAVVAQQPFGGSRGSGTNDKAGSMFNLLRWVSLRTISETFNPPRAYRYPFMGE